MSRPRTISRAASADVAVIYEMRYTGQSFELPVAAGPDVSEDVLATAFHAEHERRYGFAEHSRQIELVTLRVSAKTSSGTAVQTAQDPVSAMDAPRRADTDISTRPHARFGSTAWHTTRRFSPTDYTKEPVWLARP